MRASLFTSAALVAIALVGCGPMSSGPMPPRLTAEDQKQIDEAWDKALTPADKLDRQAMLDALVLSQAYQAGVDRLTFRSEKKCAAGTVVMEIHFDRARPDDDRFEFRILAGDGGVVRELAYGRQEVEDTYKDLHNPRYDPDRDPAHLKLTADEARKRQEIGKRIAAVVELFPKGPSPENTNGK